MTSEGQFECDLGFSQDHEPPLGGNIVRALPKQHPVTRCLENAASFNVITELVENVWMLFKETENKRVKLTESIATIRSVRGCWQITSVACFGVIG